jgi:hypothetical protein
MVKYIQLEKVDKLLIKLIELKYYGKLTVVFENGNITYIRKEETLKDLD